ncbi:sensor histidine kinase [Metabacillus idriensis]|uniref:sensor histidine kinase n=1 Tax=Metabacillus idriensis TaxID=324768 RepID=UPI0017491508|nr:HAMP domain-containing sensor histidine kinase [Metabacillus idriensis]
MNLKRKLTRFFVFHMVVWFIMFLTIIGATLAILMTQDFNNILEKEVKRIDPLYIGDIFQFSEDAISLDKYAKSAIKKQNGWLQVIDEEGNVVFSYLTPSSLPKKYTLPNFFAEAEKAFHYEQTYWMLHQEEESYIVLYGKHSVNTELMTELIDSGITVNETPALTKKLEETFSKKNGWLTVYNPDYSLLYSFNKQNKNLPGYYEILSYKKEPWNHKTSISSYVDPTTGNIYIIGTPNKSYFPDDQYDNTVVLSLLKGLAVFTLVTGMLFFLISIWYSNKLGRPLLHMILWIENLAFGRYEEPLSKKGVRASSRHNGKLKNSFRIYHDIIYSLNVLTSNLIQKEKDRAEMDEKREDWITGLSHDLKTPLSSLYGYAYMLQSEQYDWTKDEVQEFAGIMKDKASYMTSLIDDFNLTYRLKNNALPLQIETEEMNEIIRRTLVHILNDPLYQERLIDFQPSEEEICYPIDRKWFHRIIENLVANAIKHNPPSTSVRISLKKADDSFSIFIEDNGKGMDAATKNNLFDRYFRGTNTEESTKGTGLGLAIAKQLIHAHHGQITVWSKLGEGTRITLKFPL